MKVVIFAGGKGTRLAEETNTNPKPLVEIGNKPILWHIMKIYSAHGHKDFIICLGYKGYLIKEWFYHYFLHNSDVTIDLATNQMEIHNKRTDDWKVTLVDTGLHSGTSERLKQIKPYINEENFMLTYGDGVSDINISELVKFHLNHNKIATMTTIIPEGRFGSVKIAHDDAIIEFSEKIDNVNSWINGGFFVLRKDVFDYLPEDKNVMWEKAPLEKLVKDKQLMSFRHTGFWKAMDTLRDKLYLENLWETGNVPWKKWT